MKTRIYDWIAVSFRGRTGEKVTAKCPDRFTSIAPRRRTASLRRGATLVETLIASLLSLFVGSALLMLIQSTMVARTTVLDGNASMRDTRDCLDALANNIRNAQFYGSTGVFSAATANSVTMYTKSDGTTSARYWLDTTTTPYSFKSTIGGTTTVLLTDVRSVTFTYYLNASTNFTSATTWSAAASPSAPTAAEIPNIGSVTMTVTITNGGVSRTLTTRIRLRNSPAKPHI